MAARKVCLSAPAEFTKKPEKPRTEKAKKPFTFEKQVLHPPSEYKVASVAKGLDVEEPDTLNVNQRTKDKLSQPLTETRPKKEQKSCFKDNLSRQTESIQIGNEENLTTTDVSKLTGVLSELQKSRDQNRNLHISLEKQSEKQAKTLEKITEQFLEQNNELATENERLRRKLFMISEESKEIKNFLEKEIEAKERTISMYVSDLKNNQHKHVEVLKQLENNEQKFSEAIQTKDNVIEDLKRAINEITINNEKLCSQLHAEKEKILKEHSREISVFRMELEKRNEELALELESYKVALKTKANEYDEIKTKLGLATEKNDSLEGTVKTTLGDFANFKDETKKSLYDNSVSITNLKEQLRNQESSFTDEIEMIRAEHKIDKEKDIIVMNDLKEKLKMKVCDLQHAHEQIEDLQVFVAEKISESNIKSYEHQIKSLNEENSQLKETCRSFESAVELLNVRVLSLNNIIKIQEDEIVKSGNSFTGEKSSNLLSKWRDKVYSLLVQLKSQEIMEKDDIYKLKRKLQTCVSHLEENKGKVLLLTNQLTEKAAEVGLKDKEIKTLINNRNFHKDNENKANMKCNEYREHLLHLSKEMETLSSIVHGKMEKIDKGIKAFKTLDGRVNFANERLRVIRELFNRRMMILLKSKSKMKESDDGNVADAASDLEDENLSSLNRNSLVKEVENLTKERQLLLKQVKDDSLRLTNIKEELKLQYESQLTNRETRIDELEQELQLQKIQTEKMREEIDSLQMDNEEKNEEIETLKSDWKVAQTKFETELDNQLGEQKLHHQDEVNELQKVINNAQREHTKTIASLRQLERQLNWQKQNAEDLLKQNEEVHKFEMEKLKQRAIGLEKERNLLVATVKQENLKLPPTHPKEFDTTQESIYVKDDEKQIHRYGRTSRHASKSKSNKTKSKDLHHKELTGMLKELKSISASLLQEDSSLLEPRLDDSINHNSTSEEF